MKKTHSLPFLTTLEKGDWSGCLETRKGENCGIVKVQLSVLGRIQRRGLRRVASYFGSDDRGDFSFDQSVAEIKQLGEEEESIRDWVTRGPPEGFAYACTLIGRQAVGCSLCVDCTFASSHHFPVTLHQALITVGLCSKKTADPHTAMHGCHLIRM